MGDHVNVSVVMPDCLIKCHISHRQGHMCRAGSPTAVDTKKLRSWRIVLKCRSSTRTQPRGSSSFRA